MRVIEEAPVRFKCNACDSVNEGRHVEFKVTHTIPPMHNAKCASCGCWNQIADRSLISREVGRMTPEQQVQGVLDWMGRIGGR